MTQQAVILESIRDIIAGKEPPGGDDDILDLTHKVNDDGSVTDLTVKNVERKEAKEDIAAADMDIAANEASPEPKAEKSGDILSEIDALLADDKYIQKPRSEDPIEIVLSEKEEPKTEAPVFEESSKESFIEQPIQKETNMTDPLISENSASTAKASITNLMNKLGEQNKAQGPNFKSGETVEHLVAEMLKPMMKEWLDSNLPKMVNQIVEREIAKIMATQ